MPLDNMMVFTGNANPFLAESIVNNLDMPLGEAHVGLFSDGEISVEINQNVRGKDVFIVQPTNSPCNRNLMELLVMIDALRRSSAHRITAVIPYYGYARQDRRPRSSRVPISAKLVASMIVTAGANRVLTMDLHADQIQGFFDIPTDNIYGSPVLLNHMRENIAENAVIVSPDIGGVVRARAFSKYMNSELAIIDKRRPKANVAEVMNIIGDVEGRECVLVDDMVDTANTLCKAAEALKKRGATKVHAYATHAVLSGEAVERIDNSVLDKVVLTNTIPLRDDAKQSEKIQVVCVARIIAESMRRVATEDSVSSLFLH